MASARTLTTKQVIAGFNVGHMTIFNWRKGTEKQNPLPHTVDAAGRVTFKASEVKAWAKTYERPFTTPTEAAEVTKPGPKPKAKPTESPAMKDAKAKVPAERHAAAKKATKSSKLGRQISAQAKKKFARVAKAVEAQAATA
ncbi:MAG: hypothetical protein ACRC1H_12540 [Caldilineaceae bacterium]